MSAPHTSPMVIWEAGIALSPQDVDILLEAKWSLLQMQPTNKTNMRNTTV